MVDEEFFSWRERQCAREEHIRRRAVYWRERPFRRGVAKAAILLILMPLFLVSLVAAIIIGAARGAAEGGTEWITEVSRFMQNRNVSRG